MLIWCIQNLWEYHHFVYIAYSPFFEVDEVMHLPKWIMSHQPLHTVDTQNPAVEILEAALPDFVLRVIQSGEILLLFS